MDNQRTHHVTTTDGVIIGLQPWMARDAFFVRRRDDGRW